MDGSAKASQDDPDPDPDPDFESGPGPDIGADHAGWVSTSTTTNTDAAAASMKKEKGRVRFNSNAGSQVPPPVNITTPPSVAESPDATPSITRPRFSALRSRSMSPIRSTQQSIHEFDPSGEKAMSAAAAQARAEQMAANLQRDPPSPGSPGSRDSLYSHADTTISEASQGSEGSSDIMLQDMGQSSQEPLKKTDSGDEKQQTNWKDQAYDLVRAHARPFRDQKQHRHEYPSDEELPTNSHVVPDEINDGNYDGVYGVPAPEKYRSSVLSQLLKLYKPPELGQSSSSQVSLTPSFGAASTLVGQSPKSGSGSSTPARKKWYEKNRSQETLANLVEASTRLANPNLPADKKSPGKKRPGHKRAGSQSRLSSFWQKEEVRITVHIAETLSRQEYIIQLCRALMLYGAPTHRLEEYLSMTARVLEIDGQFLYLPGCMVISFDDKSTHTTEVRIVRVTQGIDLGKLKDVHLIYKEVMHDVMGVEDGTLKLDELMKSRDKFKAWIRVLVFGVTSAACAPFSFKARAIDLPICFLLGCLVGVLQLILAPKSKLYSNVFEVTATVIVSLLARAFGSIENSAGERLFCFSALAQSGIVMLLPGYAVLCSSLELQSRAIVPGSIRIVYAIVYSLLIGFGITVGAAIYGLFDSNASSQTECEAPMSPYYGFAFVPAFVLGISMLYQAKWRQMPVMVVIAFAGYIVNFFSSQRFSASPAIANTLGALAVGVLANLYSRIRHDVAAATLIPAIFTQVPGGLASNGGLLSGITTANQLVNSTDTASQTSTAQQMPGESLNSVVFGVAGSMIQIAMGITVGLFMSALIIYPLGKRRSGLFSF